MNYIRLMTFEKAKKKMKKISKGKYHNIRYDINVHSDNKTTTQECSVYIDGYGFHKGGTWEEAIKSLEDEMYMLSLKRQTVIKRQEPK